MTARTKTITRALVLFTLGALAAFLAHRSLVGGKPCASRRSPCEGCPAAGDDCPDGISPGGDH